MKEVTEIRKSRGSGGPSGSMSIYSDSGATACKVAVHTVSLCPALPLV